MQDIDATAFTGCDPDNVTYTFRPVGTSTTVADGLMKDCLGVGMVKFADGITAIGADAVSSQTLFKVEMTTSVRAIGTGTFGSSTSYAVYIRPSEGVDKDIAPELFSGKTTLANVTLSPGVEAVRDRAFYGCTRLINVYGSMPPAIHQEVFAGCTSLQAFDLNGVETIGSYAFYGCNSERLTELRIPESITSIGSGAFQGCANVKDVRVPCTMRKIAHAAFSDCSADLTLTVEVAAASTAVADNAFNDLQSVRNIIVSEGITALGTLSFHRMPQLKNVTLPSTLTAIGDYAFQWCSGLTKIDIPSSVTTIGVQAFSDCLVTDVFAHWTEPITPSSPEPFYGRSHSLITLHVPFAAAAAYSGNSYWSDFRFETESQELVCQGVRYRCQYDADGNAFAEVIGPDISNIADLSIPETVDAGVGTPFPVKKVAQEAFLGYSSLESLTLPGNISVLDKAFSGCANLKKVSVSTDMTALPVNAFKGTFVGSSLVSDRFELEVVPGTGSYKDIFPAFATNCPNITKVTIAEGVANVCASAFRDCASMTSVVIPASVQTLSDNAFYGSDNLSDIKILADVPPTVSHENAFSSTIFENATLRVPSGAKETYSAALVWKDFQNIVEDTAGSGDADGMDGVTIDDVLAIINYILGREVPDTFDRDAADVNADGSVTMTDAALLIGRIVNPQ